MIRYVGSHMNQSLELLILVPLESCSCTMGRSVIPEGNTARGFLTATHSKESSAAGERDAVTQIQVCSHCW